MQLPFAFWAGGSLSERPGLDWLNLWIFLSFSELTEAIFCASPPAAFRLGGRAIALVLLRLLQMFQCPCAALRPVLAFRPAPSGLSFSPFGKALQSYGLFLTWPNFSVLFKNFLRLPFVLPLGRVSRRVVLSESECKVTRFFRHGQMFRQEFSGKFREIFRLLGQVAGSQGNQQRLKRGQRGQRGQNHPEFMRGMSGLRDLVPGGTGIFPFIGGRRGGGLRAAGDAGGRRKGPRGGF